MVTLRKVKRASAVSDRQAKSQALALGRCSGRAALGDESDRAAFSPGTTFADLILNRVGRGDTAFGFATFDRE
jgi:hypothetical protein